MKNNTLKIIGISVYLIAGSSAAVPSTGAITTALPSSGQLTINAYSFKSYDVTCPKITSSATLTIVDMPEHPKNTNGYVHASFGRSGSNTANTKDEDGNPNPSGVTASGGSGNYSLQVYKGHMGIENFKATVTCLGNKNNRYAPSTELQVIVDSLEESKAIR